MSVASLEESSEGKLEGPAWRVPAELTEKKAALVGKHSSRGAGWSRAWGWGTAASCGGREPEREERGRGRSGGLKGEETNFVFFLKFTKQS